MDDFAYNSQALHDSRRANADLLDATERGASPETLAELAAIQAAADQRVAALRGRAS